MDGNRQPPPYTPGYSLPRGNPPPYSSPNTYPGPNSYPGHTTQTMGRCPPHSTGQHPPQLPPRKSKVRPAPPGVNAELWNWFVAVDEDGNGHITASELEKALVNCNWTSFNPETCRLMIGMFDADRSGTIDINEFSALWKYIQEWKTCFDSFDLDRSGTIDANELHQAFQTFGYNLTMNFCNLCVRVFDRRDQRSMKLDDFIQCCVMLKVLSTKFMEKDIKRTGSITIYYEEFLKMALDNTIV